MANKILTRANDLLVNGKPLAVPLVGNTYYVANETLARAWLSSTAHLIQSVSQSGSHYDQQINKILSEPNLRKGVPFHTFNEMFGVLYGFRDDYEKGFIVPIEYIVAAATFDDFLDHAETYQKGNLKNEAAVLAGAVLEDTMKKIATKHGIVATGKTLDPVIDDLAKANVFTPIHAKRLKVLATTRNYALHAEWDKFGIREAGELISGTRELIKEFLA